MLGLLSIVGFSWHYRLQEWHLSSVLSQVFLVYPAHAVVFCFGMLPSAMCNQLECTTSSTLSAAFLMQHTCASHPLLNYAC